MHFTRTWPTIYLEILVYLDNSFEEALYESNEDKDQFLCMTQQLLNEEARTLQ